MDTLRDTLNDVNDWLKFAETKNGVLVATSGVAIWGCLRLVSLKETGCYLDTYLGVVILFLVSGFVTSLLSFLPVLNYRWIVPRPPEAKERNLLYFGHLATFARNGLLESYREATKRKESDITPLHGMYAEQIIINSRIAIVKYTIFERAVALVLWGVLTPLIAAPLLFFSRKRRKNTDGIG